MIFILNMIRSNMNSTPPELGNRQKRHSKVHYTIYHITGAFFNPTAQSMEYGRMPLLPWSCAMVQKENQTQLHEFWTLINWKYSGFLSVAPRTDPPFSDGVTERPTSDCTQHRLSVCKWTLTWPTDLSFLHIQPLSTGQLFVSAWAQSSSRNVVYILLCLLTITKFSIKVISVVREHPFA